MPFFKSPRAGGERSAENPGGKFFAVAFHIASGDDNSVFVGAIIFGNDDIVRDINQSSSQVTGFGSLQRSVGLALSGSVSGDEIFQNSQSFLVTGPDGKINNLAGRVYHQAFHPRHLSQLTKRPSGAGRHHGVNRAHFIHRSRNQVFNFIFGSLPNFYDFVVSFRIGQKAVLILAFDFNSQLFRFRQNFFFIFRQFKVVITPAYAGSRRIFETEFFYPVQNIRSSVNAVFLNQPGDDGRQDFFARFFVDVRKIVRQGAVEHQPSDGRFKNFSVENFIFGQFDRQNFYLRSYVNFSETAGQNGIVGRRIIISLSLGGRLNLGQPITAQNHIFRRINDRLAVSRP